MQTMNQRKEALPGMERALTPKAARPMADVTMHEMAELLVIHRDTYRRNETNSGLFPSGVPKQNR